MAQNKANAESATHVQNQLAFEDDKTSTG